MTRDISYYHELAWGMGQSFWSLDEVVGDIRNHVRAYVRTYVVRKYLRARSSNFSETWQLGRTWIGAGNVPSGFLN